MGPSFVMAALAGLLVVVGIVSKVTSKFFQVSPPPVAAPSPCRRYARPLPAGGRIFYQRGGKSCIFFTFMV